MSSLNVSQRNQDGVSNLKFEWTGLPRRSKSLKYSQVQSVELDDAYLLLYILYIIYFMQVMISLWNTVIG